VIDRYDPMFDSDFVTTFEITFLDQHEQRHRLTAFLRRRTSVIGVCRPEEITTAPDNVSTHALQRRRRTMPHAHHLPLPQATQKGSHL
jgi:hypothetical protein